MKKITVKKVVRHFFSSYRFLIPPFVWPSQFKSILRENGIVNTSKLKLDDIEMAKKFLKEKNNWVTIITDKKEIILYYHDSEQPATILVRDKIKDTVKSYYL